MKTRIKKQQSKEFDFFVHSNLQRYRGQYVVIVGRKVAAAGRNANDVWEKAKKQYPHKPPTLAKLPKEEVLDLGFRDRSQEKLLR